MKIKFNEKARKVLANTINDQGFVLEYRLFSLLGKNFSCGNPQRGNVVFFNDIRREFDCTLNIGYKHFIFECKSSLFDWFFIAPPEYPSDLHILHHAIDAERSSLGICTVNSHPNWKIKTCSECIELAFDAKDGISTRQYDKGRKKGEEYAQASAREDYLRSKIKQVLANTEAYIWKSMGLDAENPDPLKTISNTFFPVIITNANLHYLSYGENEVAEDGNLLDVSIYREVKYIAYNIAESMKYGDQLKEINYLVNEELGNHSQKYRGSKIKSVFIVNIRFINEFINMVMGKLDKNTDELNKVDVNA